VTVTGSQMPVASRRFSARAGLRVRTRDPSPCGTQRRLQALMARGWSVPAVASATGMRPLQLARALEHSACITPTLAVEVSEAYDNLWDQSPPLASAADRSLATASAHHAGQSGWAPPLAWDDDEIDRPDGRPAEGSQPSARRTRRSAELAEDAEFVRSAGGYRAASMRAIAARLGVPQARLEKAVSRQRAAEDRDQQLELG
jgi:hypothetical protein